MAAETCASCGSPNRVDFAYEVGGVELRNDYCGGCGATWGLKRLADDRKAKAKKVALEKARKKAEGV